MPQGMGMGILQNSGIELIYSFVIIVCALMVYFGTKELYELSSHKGIKYFRLAFLFFAIAYLFRYFVKFLILGFDPRTIMGIYHSLSPLTLLLFIYFSTMAVFYLLYSVMWKKWNGNSVYMFHVLAVVIAFIIILSNSALIYLIVNIVLFVFLAFVFYVAHTSKSRKKNNLYLIYFLLLGFWVLNILDILIPNFFREFQLLIYLASTGIFLMILYKVLKKSGAN